MLEGEHSELPDDESSDVQWITNPEYWRDLVFVFIAMLGFGAAFSFLNGAFSTRVNASPLQTLVAVAGPPCCLLGLFLPFALGSTPSRIGIMEGEVWFKWFSNVVKVKRSSLTSFKQKGMRQFSITTADRPDYTMYFSLPWPLMDRIVEVLGPPDERKGDPHST